MSIATVIDDIERLKESLTRIDECEAEAINFAAMHAIRPLRHAMTADGMTPNRRKEARGAYQMLCAAFGIEEQQ